VTSVARGKLQGDKGCTTASLCSLIMATRMHAMSMCMAAVTVLCLESCMAVLQRHRRGREDRYTTHMSGQVGNSALLIAELQVWVTLTLHPEYPRQCAQQRQHKNIPEDEGCVCDRRSLRVGERREEHSKNKANDEAGDHKLEAPHECGSPYPGHFFGDRCHVVLHRCEAGRGVRVCQIRRLSYLLVPCT
jgi:hypothetical protein